MLSKEPVRIRHDWNAAVVAHCDFCSYSEMTVLHADGGRICASCCDSEFLSSWQNYARSLATELLSLREQLAELKALELIGQVISCNGNKTLGWINDAPEGTLLFRAAKPVDVSTIQDELIEQIGVMCDRAVNIHEKNVYGGAFCVLKYGILPYLRKKGK